MQLSRRTFLATSAACAAGSLSIGKAAAFAQDANGFGGLLDRIVRDEMRLMPEIACFFALDKGADTDLRAKLTDRSATGRAAHKALIKAQLAELRGVPRAALTDADRLNLDVAIFTREVRVESQTFDFGAHESMLENTPYILNHQGGAFQLYTFSEPATPIRSRAEADMDLERLGAYEKQIDDETERFRHDCGAGVVLPDFLYERLIRAHGLAAISGEAFAEGSGFGKRIATAGLGKDYRQKAVDIFDRRVAPAIARQAAVIQSLRGSARSEAGYWQLPDGDRFYRQALKYYTTANMTPEEVHTFGREQAKEISSRMEDLLKKQGLTTGSVGDRMKALAARPDQIFPNTPDGRAALLAYARDRIEAARKKLPEAFHVKSGFAFDVIDLPPQLQTGGGGASATGPASDGSRPGSVNLDLSNTLAYPKFSLPSLLYHEGYPGHQYEIGVTLTNKLPLLRTTTIFSGFGEGWGLYSEQLADEMGLYDDDPLGRLGYLQGQLFRANRCVVDTGLHAMRWKRDEAARYLAEAGGDPVARVEKEIDRYCVMGGQACAYKVGQARIVVLREQAKAAMGAAFDLREFHAYILASGHLPLEILEARTGEWIAAKSRAS
ncbi:DUF885 domain-containing protein [Sphingopyxis panaciterrae]